MFMFNLFLDIFTACFAPFSLLTDVFVELGLFATSSKFLIVLAIMLGASSSLMLRRPSTSTMFSSINSFEH